VAGAVVELTAKPEKNWEFVKWKGDVSSTDNPIQVTVKKPKTVTAVFKQELINKSDLARIIKTLSADKMMGRDALSPDIWKAINFISSEFADIGLQPIDGQNDYLQQFPLYLVKTTKMSVTVDGKVLSEDKYFTDGRDDKDINWTQDEVLVKEIKKGENFLWKFSEYTNLDKETVVFVDASHADDFSNFQKRFSIPLTRTRFQLKPVFAETVFILGSKPKEFNITLKKKVEVVELANIAGKIEGRRKDEVVLFSAHYDHIGIVEPVRGDSIANGANDNASGTAAVIELAEYFSHQGKPERTLMFVAFTAEEIGMFGSGYFVNHFKVDDITAMINIEMLGKLNVRGANTAWITGFDESSLGTIMQENSKDIDFTFFACPYPYFYRSDNGVFAAKGVPAHTVGTTPDADPDYHRVSDEFSTLNLDHITNIVQAIAHSAKGIISGEDTPARITR
jgi:hypothetical protein